MEKKQNFTKQVFVRNSIKNVKEFIRKARSIRRTRNE